MTARIDLTDGRVWALGAVGVVAAAGLVLSRTTVADLERALEAESTTGSTNGEGDPAAVLDLLRTTHRVVMPFGGRDFTVGSNFFFVVIPKGKRQPGHHGMRWGKDFLPALSRFIRQRFPEFDGIAISARGYSKREALISAIDGHTEPEGIGLLEARIAGKNGRVWAVYPSDERDLDLVEVRFQAGSMNTQTVKRSAAETFLRLDPESVPDHLLLAVILSGATRGSSIEAAQDLLRSANGDLGRISRIDVVRDAKLGGTGRARLLAAAELVRRAEQRSASASVETIRTPEDAVRVFRALATGPDERLVALYLNRRNHVIGVRMLTKGTDQYTVVDPRQVYRAALEAGASAVVLAHQHPSGDPTPSDPDREVTRRVAAAGRVLGIVLLDHIVVGAGDSFTSLAERGELPAWS